ncbi:hypothetical protein ATANTOWER_005801, partial [Ataeniobius toweri]|nr:hypothetical protein [Ataeniobius toweri]
TWQQGTLGTAIPGDNLNTFLTTRTANVWLFEKKTTLPKEISFKSVEACRSNLCSREFPAETRTLQAESEGRTRAPHHRGYGNVQLVGGQNEPSFTHSYGC